MEFLKENKKKLIFAVSLLIAAMIFSQTYSYGAEQFKGIYHVKLFGGYNVHSQVQVKDGRISSIDIYGSDFLGSAADYNKSYLNDAVQGMKDKFIGKSASDINEIKEVDGVAKATVSSDAVKKSVMNALGLEETEVQDYLPEKVPAPGDYTVKISNVTEQTLTKRTGGGIEHSLIGGKTADALLHVDKGGKMTLSYLMKSGTENEPLYILNYNGYYDEESDNLKTPSMEGVKLQNIFWGKLKLSKYNELQGISDSVVGRVTRPLKELKAHYYENVKLYVPAMKYLNRPGFDNGKFTAVSKLSPDWKSLKKIKALNFSDGTYNVKGKLFQPDGVTPSMADGVMQENIKLEVKKNKYYISLAFGKMKKSGVEGYLGSAKYYACGYIVDDSAIQGDLKDTDILKFHTDKKGKHIEDDYGMDYPKLVRFPVISEAKLDGIVPMQLNIPVMESFGEGAGVKNVLLRLDWSSAKKQKSPKPEKLKSIKAFKVKSYGKRMVKLSWNKISKSSGYTVYMSKSPKGKLKAVKDLNAKVGKFVLKKLKSKQKLYFTVKAYKRQNGKKVYVAASKTVSVTVK